VKARNNLQTPRRGGLAGLLMVSSVVVSLPTVSNAENTPIRIGVLATLDGNFAITGEDAIRGTELAFDEFGNEIAGRKLVMIKESSNAKPDVAVAKARKLIEQDKVDLFIGPLAGSEGLAVKEYARSVPEITFMNGTSAAQDMTLRSPAPNYFRFTGDGAQWQAGLGKYAFNVKGYRTVVVVGEDYSYPYTQVAGFISEFCPLGGRILDRVWVPLGTKDFSSVFARMPEKVDAIYGLFGGADAVNFFTQYYQSGGTAAIIGGTAMMDRTVLDAKGTFHKKLVGAISAGPVADNNEDAGWKKFAAAYKQRFPNGLASPSFGAYTYYVNTKGLLTGLKQVNGDLSDGQKKLQAALAALSLDTPLGTVTLDENRQAITPNLVTEVAGNADGTSSLKVVSKTESAGQTLGIPRDVFLAKGVAGRDNPTCP
jgi:branched-chain amino acid transport system substrate-binding protein